MSATKIEWADETINPLVGCSRISPACDHCYAIGMAHRFATNPKVPQYAGLTTMTPTGPDWIGEVRWVPGVLERSLLRLMSVQRRLRIFVGSMTDIGHEKATVEHLASVLAFAAALPQHTIMLLTKRPQNIAKRMEQLHGPGFADMWDAARKPLYQACKSAATKLAKRNGNSSTPRERALTHRAEYIGMMCAEPTWPLPNVWLGTTIWDQASADRAVPILLSTPAAKRFVSVEPMLGPVDLYGGDPDPRLGGVEAGPGLSLQQYWESDGSGPFPGLDWVICGGETGPGARPMHPDWVRSLRDQCEAAVAPFFFKQWGEWSTAHTYMSTGEPSWWAFTDFNHYCAKAPTHMSRGDKLICPDGHIPTNGGEEGKSYPMVPVRRVGSRRAGRVLDGRTWEEVPNE